MTYIFMDRKRPKEQEKKKTVLWHRFLQMLARTNITILHFSKVILGDELK